jgi:hypothetical protein
MQDPGARCWSDLEKGLGTAFGRTGMSACRLQSRISCEWRNSILPIRTSRFNEVQSYGSIAQDHGGGHASCVAFQGGHCDAAEFPSQEKIGPVPRAADQQADERHANVLLLKGFLQIPGDCGYLNVFGREISSCPACSRAGPGLAGSIRVPRHLAPWPRYHVWVRFEHAVSGPVLVGIGRHYGIGLFAARGHWEG